MLSLNARQRSTSSASTSPSPSPFSSAPSSPSTRARGKTADSIPSTTSSTSALIPRAAVYVSEKEVVGDDSLGDAWKANVKGLPEVIAQRLVIHDTQEDAFYEELQQSVSELVHPGLLPVVGASKELANDEDGTIDYLLVSKKYDITADQLLKQKREESPSLDVRIGWALSIAQALHFLYDKTEDYFHGQVNLRHVHLDLKTHEAFLACWAFRSYRSVRRGRPPTLSDYHWKAPEVLVKEKRRGSLSNDEGGEDDDPGAMDAQAADVYSFGILLWELCSLKQAFTDYKSLGALIEGVSIRQHRPAIAEEWPESLGSLAQSCWDSDAEARPKFSDLACRLQGILLETSISDPLAREFWSASFSGKNEVELEVFQQSFYEFLGLPEPNKKNDVKCSCLLAILKELHEQNKEIVTIKTFSDMTHWFGPLEKGWRVIDRINELCAKPWFFGRISGKEAEEAVCKADKGAFLFRFSTSKPGSYAITVHSRRGGAKHFRVYHEPGLNYLIGKTECKSLDEIIFKFKGDLNLLGPCPGSPFLELFKQDNFLKNRYDSWETEDDDQEGDLW